MENKSDQPFSVEWESETRIKFEKMLNLMPFFARPMAEGPVAKKAQELVRKDNRSQIIEKDLVNAFFIVTPFGFHGPMMTDMESLGIDYKKYGHPIDYTKQK
ncbi:MAG: hypothetical protein KBD53_09480 [Candidatus Omnitrophica bacterium]|nr:hypothetical protein [Candidatus Omnitrophota bacterium]